MLSVVMDCDKTSKNSIRSLDEKCWSIRSPTFTSTKFQWTANHVRYQRSFSHDSASDCPQLAEIVSTILLLADDSALFSHSKALGLQRQLDFLASFYAAGGLTVKCKEDQGCGIWGSKEHCFTLICQRRQYWSGGRVQMPGALTHRMQWLVHVRSQTNFFFFMLLSDPVCEPITICGTYIHAQCIKNFL